MKKSLQKTIIVSSIVAATSVGTAEAASLANKGKTPEVSADSQGVGGAVALGVWSKPVLKVLETNHSNPLVSNNLLDS